MVTRERFEKAIASAKTHAKEQAHAWARRSGPWQCSECAGMGWRETWQHSAADACDEPTPLGGRLVAASALEGLRPGTCEAVDVTRPEATAANGLAYPAR